MTATLTLFDPETLDAAPVDELAAIERAALALMDEHGLRDLGWSFDWDRAVRRLGCCHFDTRTITLSQPYAEKLGREGMQNTIRHEVAHVLAGARHGHDDVWKMWAVRVGARPERCTSGVGPARPHPWCLLCTKCGGLIGRRYRRTQNLLTRYHSTCCQAPLEFIPSADY